MYASVPSDVCFELKTVPRSSDHSWAAGKFGFIVYDKGDNEVFSTGEWVNFDRRIYTCHPSIKSISITATDDGWLGTFRIYSKKTGTTIE